MKSYKELTVYQDSIKLVSEIYKVTGEFPNSEIYGLTSQIRRSAVSIPSNIAEGAKRNHIKENIQFLHISLGSASELDTQLEISKVLEFITKHQYDELSLKLLSLTKRLHGVIRFQKSRLEVG